jgi:hypothetical protein
MSSRQPVCDLQRVVDRFSLRQRDAAHPFAQRFTFQQFRNDVRRAVMRIDMVDNEDIWVIERARCLCFLLKSRQAIFVNGKAPPATP